MTWRAFILGLTLVIGMCWADVIVGLSRGCGWTTEGHFPESAVFLLVFVVLVVNVIIKLIRRRAGLKQAELMLIWCMLIIGSVIPSTGLMRFWLPMLAAPSYVAGRPDIQWKDTALEAAPESLLVTKNPKSLVVRHFYEGRGEEARVPWGQWLKPMACWLVFLGAFHLAVIFFCGILRRQWVDSEHLLFPLARVPLEFTQGSGGRGLLPTLFSNKAFLIGLIGATIFRLLRAIPVFMGGPSPWAIAIPLNDVLAETPLVYTYMANFQLSWMPIGFAFLVPADVSLSIWFFYFFGRLELQTAAWLGSPLHYGGTWSPLMRWQQAGSYLAFTVGALYMMRRHLADVFRKAVGLGNHVDDSGEPISFKLSFWGFITCSLLTIGWSLWFRMGIAAALVMFFILMCIQLVHIRIVCQSGLYATWLIWNPPTVAHSLSFGRIFGATGAVIAHMQHRMFMHNITLGPAAMHSFKIGAVFKKHRRWLLPALLVTLGVAVAVCSWAFLDEAYTRGGLNFTSQWGMVTNAADAFNAAHQKITRPLASAQPEWLPFGLGILLTGFVMVMRSRFYWWPIHSIGLLAISNWSADRMWLPFLLGWLTKVLLMKFGGGRQLRQARFFFIGLILSESSIKVVSTIVGALTGRAFARF